MSAVLCLGSALAGYMQPTSAVSREAAEVSKAARIVLRTRAGSHALYSARTAALSDLAETVESLVIDVEQSPVSQAVFENTEQFLLALPEALSTPGIGVDPDGAISLTWVASRTRMFSVDIDESDRIAFAWLDGTDKGHGVERFRPPVMPRRLDMMLRSIVADGTGLRVT